MNMDIDHGRVIDKALDVLDQYNIDKPVVDVLQIAEGEGYTVKEVQMPEKHQDVAGLHNAENKTIYINKEDTPTRKLFTVAHELGHIFLQHKNYGVLFRIPKQDACYTREEKEANSFAAHLLMPGFLVREYLRKYNLTINDYGVLAKIFGVPPKSMKHQLERI